MSWQSPQMMQVAFVVASILIMVVLGMFALRLTRRSLRFLEDQGYVSESTCLVLQGVIRWVIIIAVVLLSLQQIGVRVISLWTGLLTISAMVAVGFIAMWSVLSNLLCALLLVIFAPFRIGDEIEIIEATGGRGLRGKVVNLNIIYTTVQEVMEEGVHDGVTHVPNNIFFQKTIRQWQGPQTTSLEMALFGKNKPENVTPGKQENAELS
jgi:small-conductance mechanosensitive channel